MVERAKTGQGAPALNSASHAFDKLQLLENLMQQLQETIPSINSEMTRDLARAKLQDLQTVKTEVESYLHQASFSYGEARKLILSRLKSTGSLNGVLLGRVDDYLDPFEAQLEKCDA